MKKEVSVLSLFVLFFLSACSGQAAQPPGFINTVVASTQTAAAYQTEMAELVFTQTPTPMQLRATFTPYPTQTVYVYTPPPSETPTPTVTVTKAPRILTEWPDWKSGEVVRIPSGSGANIGTNKKFSDLTGLMVKVVRKNGVAMRSMPSKAIGGPMEEKGSAFTLTGIMNRNPEFAWEFVQVIAADGNTYWVGGSDNTAPQEALAFYYPKLTPSPTPGESATPTVTVLPTTSPPPPSPTFPTFPTPTP